MRIVLPIDDSLVKRVDAASGKQPRVSWIRDAIEEKLAGLGPHSEPSIIDAPMVPLPTVVPRKSEPVPDTDLTSRPVEPKRHHPACTCLVCKPA